MGLLRHRASSIQAANASLSSLTSFYFMKQFVFKDNLGYGTFLVEHGVRHIRLSKNINNCGGKLCFKNKVCIFPLNGGCFMYKPIHRGTLVYYRECTSNLDDSTDLAPMYYLLPRLQYNRCVLDIAS